MRHMILTTLVISLSLTQRIGISIIPVTTSSLLQQSDLSAPGVFRTCNSCAADPEFSYGGLAIRYVGGERHFLLYNSVPGGTVTQVASAASASVVTLQSGDGARLATGEWMNINRAAATAGSLPEQGQITNIAGDTITVSPAFGATPQAGDQIYYAHDYVIELVDPLAPSCNTGNYTTDYTTSPRACLYAIWPNIYGDGHHSMRTSWSVSGVPDNASGILANGIYVDTTHTPNRLYMGWGQLYAASNQAASLMFATLDSVTAGVGSSTAYGPWRPVYTDGDGVTQRGAKAMKFFSINPGDGTFLGTSWAVGQIDATSSWGPDVRWGITPPDTTTTAGFGAPDLSLNHTGANYYCMIQGTCQPSTNYVTQTGNVVGTLRAARHPAAFAYLFEDFSQDNTNYSNNRSSATGNAGISSWDGSDSVEGIIRITVGGKTAVIMTGGIAGQLSTDTTNCNNDHSYYENGGIGSIATSSHSGTFTNGETITATGGFSAIVTAWNSPTANVLGLTSVVGTVAASATVTGGTSGATAVVSTFTTHGKCSHLCTPSNNVAGGVSNNINPYLWFDNPADIDAVNAGSKTDYTVDPYLVLNMGASPFNFHTAPITNNGGARTIRGVIFDPVANDLFVIAPNADDTIGGILFPLFWKLHVGP